MQSTEQGQNYYLLRYTVRRCAICPPQDRTGRNLFKAGPVYQTHAVNKDFTGLTKDMGLKVGRLEGDSRLYVLYVGDPIF